MEAKALQDFLIEYFATSGSQLRKWPSSDNSLVDRLPERYWETTDTKPIEAKKYFIKTLGVVWKPKHDIFIYNVKFCPKLPVSSTPWVSSCLSFQLESFIQSLWLEQLRSDEYCFGTQSEFVETVPESPSASQVNRSIPDSKVRSG